LVAQKIERFADVVEPSGAAQRDYESLALAAAFGEVARDRRAAGIVGSIERTRERERDTDDDRQEFTGAQLGLGSRRSCGSAHAIDSCSGVAAWTMCSVRASPSVDAISPQFSAGISHEAVAQAPVLFSIRRAPTLTTLSSGNSIWIR
jgi:hypothetical protein